ncbi:unnamed protein product [marine sediment metagenome]|uniref:Uncharacterized protein n=1 Tax=marine sediment metagenome TaxID=412755 RepID=X1JWF1_9ZZZZ
MQVNEPLTIFSWDDAVTVVIGNDGLNKLTMTLDLGSADLYTAYGVNIRTADYEVFLSVTKDDLETSKVLTEGIYIFEETINATTGPNAGSAEVKVTYTLGESE